MSTFIKGGSTSTPFGRNEFLRSTQDVKTESYTLAASTVPARTIDGVAGLKILQPGTVLAKITSTGEAGKVGPLPVTCPTIPDTRNTARNATNQRTPERAPLNTRAPSGARMPHRPTAPEPVKPPTNAMEIVGASRMSSSSTRRNHAASRVREKVTIATIEMTRRRIVLMSGALGARSGGAGPADIRGGEADRPGAGGLRVA